MGENLDRRGLREQMERAGSGFLRGRPRQSDLKEQENHQDREWIDDAVADDRSA